MAIDDYLDRKTLNERLDGDMELLKELVVIFNEDSPQLMSNIKDAIDKKDAESLRKSAHTLKGSVANFSAKAVFDISFELEKNGKNNELQDVESTFNQLTIEIKNFLKALEDISKEEKI